MDYISYWKEKGEYGEIRIQRMIIRKKKRKEKGSKSHTCELCHKVFPYPVTLQINPYYSEMEGIISWERICRDCYESACGDI